MKKLNILKNLTNKSWGADCNVLLKTYQATIRTKIDYGSIISNSASSNTLQALEKLQNAAARIALGAFSTNPIAAKKIVLY